MKCGEQEVTAPLALLVMAPRLYRVVVDCTVAEAACCDAGVISLQMAETVKEAAEHLEKFVWEMSQLPIPRECTGVNLINMAAASLKKAIDQIKAALVAQCLLNIQNLLQTACEAMACPECAGLQEKLRCSPHHISSELLKDLRD